ncbi:glycosyltransferase [Companilactobacillus jidongensis]|uniref:glycosyltransferase n=1 Tax=Companilactobacillus jidongensis TaxID=2486006 RepID=UPI000F7B6BBD|nr:glycosyltransferase [Companilactobacillus jidongensis]
MNILFCGDNKIQDGLLISIISLMKYANESLKIYVLTASSFAGSKKYVPISDKSIKLLNMLIKQQNVESSVVKIDITELTERVPPKANQNTRFTPNCMLRLYADEVDSLPDKILYLDTDVVCCSDFSDFYNQDISDYEVAGALDRYGKWLFHNEYLFFDYINSGVLLLNLKAIRKSGLFTKCRLLCQNKTMFMPDQSAINKLSVSKKITKKKYNEQNKLTDNTVFRHFTTKFKFFPYIRIISIKPWETQKDYKELNNAQFEDVIDNYQLQVRRFQNE